MLLSEAWKKYQQDKKIEGYSTLTLKTYCLQFNLLWRFFGDRYELIHYRKIKRIFNTVRRSLKAF